MQPEDITLYCNCFTQTKTLLIGNEIPNQQRSSCSIFFLQFTEIQCSK